ncbi:hypothetical protein [Burkholderia sp. LAS2]|uniref:hypothetical protein n=1 Tax=Burkholderia sp. LAS2 TaxID=2813843 RepID=UPI001BCDDACA|nr:hypothetical protein [Burkholderia sp. LAS2]QVN10515.1 hypothetical protein JYG37_14380 [Burkholderia sp. LAS2]
MCFNRRASAPARQQQISGIDQSIVGDRNVVIYTDKAKDISDLAFGVNYHGLIEKPVYSSETVIPPGVKFEVVGVDEFGRVILEQL